MPYIGVVGIVEGEQQRGAMPDIEVVRLSVASSIKSELRKLNHNVASGDVALQNSVLIVIEFAIQYGQVCAVLPNASTVIPKFLWDRGIGKFNVFNHSIGALRNKNPFVLRQVSLAAISRQP